MDLLVLPLVNLGCRMKGCEEKHTENELRRTFILFCSRGNGTRVQNNNENKSGHYGEGNSRIWSIVCRRVCGRSATTALSAPTEQKVRLSSGCTAAAAWQCWGAPRGPCICEATGRALPLRSSMYTPEYNNPGTLLVCLWGCSCDCMCAALLDAD